MTSWLTLAPLAAYDYPDMHTYLYNIFTHDAVSASQMQDVDENMYARAVLNVLCDKKKTRDMQEVTRRFARLRTQFLSLRASDISTAQINSVDDDMWSNYPRLVLAMMPSSTAIQTDVTLFGEAADVCVDAQSALSAVLNAPRDESSPITEAFAHMFAWNNAPGSWTIECQHALYMYATYMCEYAHHLHIVYDQTGSVEHLMKSKAVLLRAHGALEQASSLGTSPHFDTDACLDIVRARIHACVYQIMLQHAGVDMLNASIHRDLAGVSNAAHIHFAKIEFGTCAQRLSETFHALAFYHRAFAEMCENNLVPTSDAEPPKTSTGILDVLALIDSHTSSVLTIGDNPVLIATANAAANIDPAVLTRIKLGLTTAQVRAERTPMLDSAESKEICRRTAVPFDAFCEECTRLLPSALAHNLDYMNNIHVDNNMDVKLGTFDVPPAMKVHLPSLLEKVSSYGRYVSMPSDYTSEAPKPKIEEKTKKNIAVSDMPADACLKVWREGLERGVARLQEQNAEAAKWTYGRDKIKTHVALADECHAQLELYLASLIPYYCHDTTAPNVLRNANSVATLDLLTDYVNQGLACYASINAIDNESSTPGIDSAVDRVQAQLEHASVWE